MKNIIQYALNTFRRAQAFLDENAAKLGALAVMEGRKKLDLAVQQLESHALDHSSWELEMRGHISVRRSLERELRTEHMVPLAKYSRAKLRGVPDFAALSRSTKDLKRVELVNAARAMAAAAAPYGEAFARDGFPADVVAQLSAAADRLQASIDARVNMKVNRVEAGEGLDAQAQHGREALRVIGAAIERQFAKDRTFLAGWRAAKRYNAKPGKARAKDTADQPVGTAESVKVNA